MAAPFIFVVLLLCGSMTLARAGVAVTASTASGPVVGNLSDGVYAFLGVPFAAPPVGELRWRAPQPVTPWTTPRTAFSFASDCAQEPNGFAPASSEDCLYLQVPFLMWFGCGGCWDLAWLAQHTCSVSRVHNAQVWTPSMDQSQPLAVQVWLYGGAYVTGSSRWASCSFCVGFWVVLAHALTTRACLAVCVRFACAFRQLALVQRRQHCTPQQRGPGLHQLPPGCLWFLGQRCHALPRAQR
jgi:hypothetical protein